MARYWVGLFALLVLVQNSQADEGASVAKVAGQNWGAWENARASYDAGKYEDALQELRAHPAPEAGYYFNVGNVLFRLGRFGEALAYFEKADFVKPHDADISHNLSSARSAVSQVLGKSQLDPASSWLERTADKIPLDEVRGILGIMGFVVILLWLRPYLRTRDIRKTILHPAGLLGCFAFILTLSLYTAQRYASSQPPAFCVERQQVRSGPGKNYADLATVEAGTKLRITGATAVDASQATWQQVRHAPDAIGWIPASSLLLL
ncbi:MAG: SH3 domain-containing protein [Bacteriovoracia bacterium]